MHQEDKILQDKLEEAKEKNLNLRFDNVEKQLTEIKEILRESNTLSKTEIESLKARVTLLEEHRRACPIVSIKQETVRYSRETSFIRGLFKNPWKGILITSVFVIIIVTLVLVFGPSAIFETLLKLKGL